MMESLLPRHLQIIYEINGRFLKEVAAKITSDPDRIARMSLIDEQGERYVRMANMCIIGSTTTNGVAKLHSEILKESLFRDFFDLMPEKFTNVTNGITPRRWLLKANPMLSQLITETIGPEWVVRLEYLHKLESHGSDPDFIAALAKIKASNKRQLAAVIKDLVGEDVDPSSLFDVQVKRLHEYKRQLMLALYIIMRCNRIANDSSYDPVPRTFVFAAKAAPGYWMAKLVIRFIHDLARTVNRDPRLRGLVKVVFLPDYRVSLAERIIPAADLSEQISLAGMEASGTGNMKFMMNGALTIGTFDGANVEINEQVGDENMFLFGMRTPDVARMRPVYNARECAANDPEISAALQLIKDGRFSPGDPLRYEPILRSLLDYNDHYMLLADLRSYSDAQDRVDATYRDPARWGAMSLVNIARSGLFSSDRAVAEYARNIWHVAPVMFG
jgi:starch phosphorylase